MSHGDNPVGPEDISSEIVIIEPRPKFTGKYSDVLIGRFRGQLVGVIDSLEFVKSTAYTPLSRSPLRS